MDINEIINSIPYLTKGQLYKLHSEAASAIKQVEESEQRYCENVRRMQREIVDEMNKCLREFHTLSASLRALDSDDSDDYADNYSDCFVDGDYECPVFGFSIDCDDDICVSVNPDDEVAAWYREEKKELAKRKNEKKG